VGAAEALRGALDDVETEAVCVSEAQPLDVRRREALPQPEVEPDAAPLVDGSAEGEAGAEAVGGTLTLAEGEGPPLNDASPLREAQGEALPLPRGVTHAVAEAVAHAVVEADAVPVPDAEVEPL